MVRLTSDDGARILIEALRTLDGQQLTPATLAVREPSLDDVFIALTGHRAEAAGGSPDPAEADKRAGSRGAT